MPDEFQQYFDLNNDLLRTLLQPRLSSLPRDLNATLWVATEGAHPIVVTFCDAIRQLVHISQPQRKPSCSCCPPSLC